MFLQLQDRTRFSLRRAAQDLANRWIFPPETNTDHLIGRHCAVSYCQDTLLASKSISFTREVVSTDYRRPSEDCRWMFEAGKTDTKTLRAASELQQWKQKPDHKCVLKPASIFRVTRRLPSEALYTVLQAVASLAANQRGIREQELASLFVHVLGLSWSAVWAVIRAWVEIGLLDCLIETVGDPPLLCQTFSGIGIVRAV